MSDATFIEDGQGDAEFGDYVRLLKPRVMSLVIFTALVGLLVAPAPVHPVIGFAAILFVAIGAGASGALNMWWDADIDAVMKRTAQRPVPAGRVAPSDAMQLGLWLSALSVVMLALVANWISAALLAFTIFFYAVIYTMWLKRWTPQNIVIGGAAGAFPPMIGWAIATGGISLESLLMFALIFLWTPPHFWALSLFMNDDYHRAGVPMMTVARGKPHTRKLVFWYTLLLVPAAVGLAFTSVGGWFYFSAAMFLNLLFFLGALEVARRSEDDADRDGYAAEKKLFKRSIAYLFLSFGALLVEGVLRVYGLSSPLWGGL